MGRRRFFSEGGTTVPVRALAVVAVVLMVGVAFAPLGLYAIGQGPVGSVSRVPSTDESTPVARGDAGTVAPTTGADPGIVAVHPNPVAAGDRGEYVIARLPGGAGWTLTDGETTVPLPGRPGRVVVTGGAGAPGETDANLCGRTVPAPDLRLANAGEELQLRHGDRVVNRVA